MKQESYIAGECQSSVARFKALCLTLILCIGASTAAHAGSYAVSYDGGTASSNFSSAGGNPYSLASDGSYGRAVLFGWGMYGFDSGGADFQGAITTTFTWQPDGVDDPSPTSVVIAEEGYAGAQGSIYGDAAPTTDTRDNALGFSLVFQSPSDPNNLTGASRGTRYQIKENPGQSFTITCSPKISIQGTASTGPQESHVSGAAGLSYKATALPLEVVLSGGIGARDDKHFLVGQQVTGTLSTGGLSATNFNWSVSGGEPFKSWTPTQTPNTATTFAQYPGDISSQTSFCFRKYTGSTATVSCLLRLLVPAGALPAAGFNLNLSRDCTVDKPSNALAVYIGTVQGVVASRTPGPNPVAIQLVGAYDSNSPTFLSGIIWDGRVTTPTDYGFGGGWNYTQLITPNRLVRIAGVDYRPTFQGRQVLDAWFGYNSISAQNHNLYGDTGTPTFEGDTPGQPFLGGSYIETLDSFVTYTMYLPPGAGSQYVPLKNLKWFWQGQAQRNSSGSYDISNTNAQWSPLQDFPTHPMWPDTEPTNPVPFSPPLP